MNNSKVAFLVCFKWGRDVCHGISGEGDKVTTLILIAHVNSGCFWFLGLCFVEVVTNSES